MLLAIITNIDFPIKFFLRTVFSFSFISLRQVITSPLMKMIDVKRDIFMYGSDKVFRSFNKWLLYSHSFTSLSKKCVHTLLKRNDGIEV